MSEKNVAPAGSANRQGQELASEAQHSGEMSAQPAPETIAICPEPRAAIAFLQQLAPDGLWVLTAITPDARDTPTTTRTFAASEAAEAQAWIAAENGRGRNIYYMLAQPRSRLSRKAAKDALAATSFLHCDVDPRAGEDVAAERERILAAVRAFEPAPSVIVDSGGGFQVLLRLAEPAPLASEAERVEVEDRNRALEIALGGDHCWNCDRVLRLPGTVNWPDAKKRKRGRTAALARVVEWHDSRVYPLQAVGKVAVARQEPAAAPRGSAPRPPLPAELPRVETVADLDRWGVPDWCKALVVQGRDPAKHPSRSEAVHAVCCELARRGVPDEVAAAVLLNHPDFGIAESIVEKGRNARAYAERQIARGREKSADFATHEGRPEASQRNIRLALAKLDVQVSHDMFADRLLIDGPEGEARRHLGDADMKRLYLLVDRSFGFRAAQEFFWMVVEDEARANAFHPVHDYLDALRWDGTPRLDTWLSTYGGAEDTPYVRAVGRLVLVAAARRVRQPGCKFDEMLVLESPQGRMKSSALRVLAVQEDWFSDDLPLGGDSKKAIESLAGRWIVEAGELKGMRRGDVENLKAFLSRGIDRARLAYGRLVTEVPRQCVIVGTTNSERYLRDGTGNRRFWPVRVGRFDIEALRRDRDQLWAEAAAAEAAGESIRLDPVLYPAAAEEQDARRVEEPWVGLIGDALGDRVGKLRAEDAWLIVDVPSGQRTQEHNGRLGDAMRELGFERKRLRFGSGPEWGYARGTAAERERRILVQREGRALWVRYEGKARPTPPDPF